MYTDADMNRDSAQSSAMNAARDLSKILIDKCHGHDDYTPEYLDGLREALNKLLEVDQLIRGKK